MKYPVVLHGDDGVRYGVTVPDLPGCFSAGDSMDEAPDNAIEAIKLHLEGLTEDGGEVPEPGTLELHIKDPDFAGGVWALVEVDTSRFDGKAEKINITLPSRLLARVDGYARAHNMTRSGFPAKAAQQAMRG